MAGFAVEGSGGTYLVMRDGVTVGGPYANKWWAEDACDALEHTACLRERPCITCGTLIMSGGAHHRMCNTCRHNTDFDGAA